MLKKRKIGDRKLSKMKEAIYFLTCYKQSSWFYCEQQIELQAIMNKKQTIWLSCRNVKVNDFSVVQCFGNSTSHHECTAITFRLVRDIRGVIENINFFNEILWSACSNIMRTFES